jgi:putative GTP pyrophosphokinase
MPILFPAEEFTKLKDMVILYECGLKIIGTRLDILMEDFKNIKKTNPIEHVKIRMKSPESTAEKLYRRGLPVTAQSARENIKDIAGIRIICPYARDIYYIAKVLRGLPDVAVAEEKDYVTTPKPTGYRSYHMILDVPVYLSDKTEIVPVETQIRTQAMDFWATLEHKARYKYEEKIPQALSDELVLCADKIAELDLKMFEIHEKIRNG